MSNPRPLDDLLVVALEQAVAAPYASCRMAEAGARVVKVERADGDFARHYDHVVDGMSANFVWINRGKESLVLDIKQAGDLALLNRILARADVFIQNLSAGAAARAGLDGSSLRAANPKLISCSISGYGDNGPYADMKAYDLLVQGECGLAAVTGEAGAPSRVGVSVCDIAAGLYAYQAVLEALILRGRTRTGTDIHVSLFDGMADWMTVPLLFREHGGRAPKRSGLRHPSIAPYEAFVTLDGHDILIAIQNEREWAVFAREILGQPGWIRGNGYGSPSERVANRDRLHADIQAVFGKRVRAEMEALLQKNRIAFGAVNTVEGLSAHPVLRRIRVETPKGVAWLPASPAVIEGWEPRAGSVPGLGDHTEAIKREFGP